MAECVETCQCSKIAEIDEELLVLVDALNTLSKVDGEIADTKLKLEENAHMIPKTYCVDQPQKLEEKMCTLTDPFSTVTASMRAEITHRTSELEAERTVYAEADRRYHEKYPMG